MKTVRFFLTMVLVCLMSSCALFVLKNPSRLKSFLYRTSVVGIKNTREFLAGFLVFGNYDQANWHLILAQKRLVEAEELRTWGDFNNFKKFVIKSEKESLLSEEYLQKAVVSGEDVNYLKQELEKIKRNQNEININD